MEANPSLSRLLREEGLPPGGILMSFVHYEIVGHIDPSDPVAADWPPHPKVVRVVDPAPVVRVLSSMAKKIDHIVHITSDGFVRCQWSSDLSVGRETVELFVRRLADEIGGIVMDQEFHVYYPDSAKEVYLSQLPEILQRMQEARMRWDQQRALLMANYRPMPFKLDVRQHETIPCPYCGKPLRTYLAKQCRFCKMDWHDPDNVHRRE